MLKKVRPSNNSQNTKSVSGIPDRLQEKIGPYKILERLGEGGMGLVYLVEQEIPIKRRLALKVIKLGMDTHEVVARFESERQVLALMNHPNIAKVVDAGATEKGRPYFVMEYVTGIPITSYCDKNRLSISERLVLFNQACNAIQHAHQKGIIHRDIKPSNILVEVRDGEAIARIIDFGIAKAIGHRLSEGTFLTMHGQLVGTPAYMSPEQAEMDLDIDTTTDVYSLGIVLYELLVGALPFDPKSLESGGLDSMRRIIREDDPPTMTSRLRSLGTSADEVAKLRNTDSASLQKRLRGDLNWITMRAIVKNRTKRYQSVTELADDLNRFVRHVPVKARPPSIAYRASKFICRNKAVVATVGVVMFALLMGITGITFGLLEANEQRNVAEQEVEKAKAANKFLKDMLSSADPGKSGRDVRVLDILDRACEDVGLSFENQPELQVAVRNTLGETLIALGEYDKAQSQLEMALTISKTNLGEEHLDTMICMHNLSEVFYYQGDLRRAENMTRRTLEIRKRVLGKEHYDTLSSMSNLGAFLNQQGEYQQAESIFRELKDLSLEAFGEDDTLTLTTLNNLAFSLEKQKKYEEAEELYRQALIVRQHVLGKDHPLTLLTMTNLGMLLNLQKKYVESEGLLRESYEKKLQILGEDHQDTLRSMGGLAVAVCSSRPSPDAEALFKKVLEKSAQVLQPGHWRLWVYKGDFGSCLYRMGRYQEAEILLQEAFSGLNSNFGIDHTETQRVCGQLVSLYEEAGMDGKATIYRSMLPDFRKK